MSRTNQIIRTFFICHIYFSEKFLLLNDESNAKIIESGLTMVQREMARQWFGNLVTCSWWDYMWLHDAFAVYFQYFGIHSVYK